MKICKFSTESQLFVQLLIFNWNIDSLSGVLRLIKIGFQRKKTCPF